MTNRHAINSQKTDLGIRSSETARWSTNKGGEALLKHSSSEIIVEVYLHLIPVDTRTAVQKVEDLLIGPKWTHVVQIPKMAISPIRSGISCSALADDFRTPMPSRLA
jgi:hypothetical protein